MNKLKSAVAAIGISVGLLAGCSVTSTKTDAGSNSSASNDMLDTPTVEAPIDSSVVDQPAQSTQAGTTTAESSHPSLPDPTDGSADAESATAESSTLLASPSIGAYVSPGGEYSVTFSGEPTSETESQMINGVSIEAVATSFSSTEGSEVIIYGDYAPALGDNAELYRELDAFFKGALSEAGGTEVSRQELEVNGRPALRFEFAIPSGDPTNYGAGLVVAEGTVLYQLFALGDDPDDLAAFIDSFQLLN